MLLFYDGFTVTNHIGHAVKKYKLGAFYMLLSNLRPKYRSQLHVIQLVALVEADHLKSFGFTQVLDPLIQDLKMLEVDGIKIEKPEGLFTFQGRRSSVLGEQLKNLPFSRVLLCCRPRSGDFDPGELPQMTTEPHIC